MRDSLPPIFQIVLCTLGLRIIRFYNTVESVSSLKLVSLKRETNYLTVFVCYIAETAFMSSKNPMDRTTLAFGTDLTW
jgi:hypothetical protein